MGDLKMFNSIQIPNVIIDYWMKRLNAECFKVLFTIACFSSRKEISTLEKICQKTFLDQKIVNECLKSLEDLKLILKEDDFFHLTLKQQ